MFPPARRGGACPSRAEKPSLYFRARANAFNRQCAAGRGKPRPYGEDGYFYRYRTFLMRQRFGRLIAAPTGVLDISHVFAHFRYTQNEKSKTRITVISRAFRRFCEIPKSELKFLLTGIPGCDIKRERAGRDPLPLRALNMSKHLILYWRQHYVHNHAYQGDR